MNKNNIPPPIEYQQFSEEDNRKRDPNALVCRTVKNFRINYKINAPGYKYYADWVKRGGYFSTQLETDLQIKILKAAMSNSTNHPMWEIQADNKTKEASSINYVEMPLFPIDIEKDILDDFTTVLVGKRRSGKSYTLRWMLYHLRHRFPFGIVITGTKLNNFWQQYVPEEFIFDIEDINEVMFHVFERQKFILKNGHLKIDPRMFIILDDVMADKYAIRFNISLSKCFTDGRHQCVSTFITCQDPKGIGPDLRENTDLCIIFRIVSGGRKEVVAKEWLGELPENMAKQFLHANTGYLDKDTGERFKELPETTDEELAEKIPQAIAVCHGRSTDNLQKIFKKSLAEEPPKYTLGKLSYYMAWITGDYKPIMGTDNRSRKVPKPRKEHVSIPKKNTTSSSSSD